MQHKISKMKKILFVLVITLINISLYGQLTTKSTTSAQKATSELAKALDLTGEQVTKALKIQEDKFTALSKLESFKNKDLKKYNAKRFSILELADNELSIILDERQLALFKKTQAEKSAKYNSMVSSLKKKGLTESAIQKTISETEF